MNDEARELYNSYMRNWRAKNKDKVKANNAKYWEKKVREKKLKESEGDK